MRFRGQSAVEWLLTHSWSIIVVLSVSAVLFYAGVFEATARPRFEGLASSGVQPVSEQVQLYSDGVLVFTVLNTRPYPIRLEWVEVAPIADRDDVVRTVFGEIISSGDVGVFNVNASNLLSVLSAGLFFVPSASAAGQFVDFFICWNESYIAGGRSSSRVVCGNAWRITYVSEPYPSDGGVLLPCYSLNPGALACESDEDCGGLTCMYCEGPGGHCHDGCSNHPEPINCIPGPEGPCEGCGCTATIENPTGECIVCDLCAP